MRLTVNIEEGDLGTRAGLVHTTIERPGTINILFDHTRVPDFDWVRAIIHGEIDKGLYALTYDVPLESVKLFMQLDKEMSSGNT